MRGSSLVCLECTGALRPVRAARAERGDASESYVEVACGGSALAAAGEAVLWSASSCSDRVFGTVVTFVQNASLFVILRIITEHLSGPSPRSPADACILVHSRD